MNARASNSSPHLARRHGFAPYAGTAHSLGAPALLRRPKPPSRTRQQVRLASRRVERCLSSMLYGPSERLVAGLKAHR